MNSNRLTISMIVLHDKCYAIGKDNEIIVTSESHRVFVENIVKNSAVIMGKETYKHIYNNFDDSVEIIVVSDDDELHDSDHVHCFNNVDDAMYFVEDLRVSDVFILGGESIFEQYFHLVDYVYVTYIDMDLFGNKFFNNDISEREFELEESQSIVEKYIDVVRSKYKRIN